MGRGGLFLLVGAAGIGKTRLADEAARAAQARGLKALWGRCWETGGAPAYWPWIQVLRELVRPEGAGAGGVGPGPVLLSRTGSGCSRRRWLLLRAAGGGRTPASGAR